MRQFRDRTGLVLVILTWILFIFANWVTTKIVFYRWFSTHGPPLWGCLRFTEEGGYLFLTYQALFFFAVLSHVRAVLSNPGTLRCCVPVHPPASFADPRKCVRCGSRWKPPRAHHCRKCEECVFRMDHHCTWISNCVGLLNQKFFVLFLSYTAILCAYTICLMLAAVYFWLRSSTAAYSIWWTFLGAAVILKCVCFCYMTTDFLSEQLEALETNSTLVESHQHTHGPQGTTLSHVTDVFGIDRWMWIFPTRPKLVPRLEEPVYLDRIIADRLRAKTRRTFLAESGAVGDDGNLTHLDHARGDSTSPLHARGGESMLGGTVVNRRRLANLTTFEQELRSMEQMIGDGFYDKDFQFKNVYVKPTTDIGVDLDDDDEGRYINMAMLNVTDGEEDDSYGEDQAFDRQGSARTNSRRRGTSDASADDSARTALPLLTDVDFDGNFMMNLGQRAAEGLWRLNDKLATNVSNAVDSLREGSADTTQLLQRKTTVRTAD